MSSTISVTAEPCWYPSSSTALVPPGCHCPVRTSAMPMSGGDPVELAVLAEPPQIARQHLAHRRRQDAYALERAALAESGVRHHVVGLKQRDLVAGEQRSRQ